ncbi:AAA family ATPase [uncultured Thiodictyon sp.]|jgi:predicted ATP-binding protein involved in virulence|uniref:AAA family ATPase n=1 Tax=uncultured Thiodictyon sp. TaxID=1846217 RepID=UPI0025CD41A7|nr:AAA family ATPase [uncultured Thiodictyon sp.]
MRLKSVRLENFRAKEKVDIDLGWQLTVLIGANGSGKTTILDGISIGLGAALTHLPNLSGLSFSKNGDIRQADNKLAPYARITLETMSSLKWDRTQRRDKSKTTGQIIPPGLGVRDLEQFLDREVIDPLNQGGDFQVPLFVYYGVGRALLDLPLTRKGFPKQHSRLEALANALNANSRFKSAFIWFYNKENEEHRLQKEHRDFDIALPELDAARRAITSLFPDLSEPHIELNPLRFVVKQGGEWLNIGQLSDGYKTLLGLVIDLSARMAMANPQIPDPLAAEAIVMIDEVDLHLHPSWQGRVVGDLLNTFKNTQFIITTHSPYIVESINNSLKRNKISSYQIQETEIESIIPLVASDVAAYLTTADQEQSLMNSELGLLDDRLLENFNDLTRLYDKMRDIEWEHRP